MDAPRCTATSKRTGERCKGPARRGWSVCRFHGAGGGAPTGARNGAWKGGHFSNDARETRQLTAALIKAAAKILK